MDILSITLPCRPSIVVEYGQEHYERENDKNVTIAILNKVNEIAKRDSYRIVIFNNIGVGINKHPVDDFIRLLADTVRSGIECYYILLPKGTKMGNGRDDRYLFCRYRKELSTRVDDPNSECDEPVEDNEPIEDRPQRRQIVEYAPNSDSDA